MSVVTPKSMRACYSFLRVMLFDGFRLPDPSRIKFVARPLKRLHGAFETPPYRITIDTSTKTIPRLLQIMAHEMVHLALEHGGSTTDHERHDHHFKALADIIRMEMCWPKDSV